MTSKKAVLVLLFTQAGF